LSKMPAEIWRFFAGPALLRETRPTPRPKRLCPRLFPR